MVPQIPVSQILVYYSNLQSSGRMNRFNLIIYINKPQIDRLAMAGLVPGIAPPGTHLAAPPRVYLTADTLRAGRVHRAVALRNKAVGLRSVAQLT